MDIENATELIYNELCYAYCDNCRGNEKEIREKEPDFCECCNRKSQNWAVSKNTAEAIAKAILTT
jgi:Zn-finger domain-containing protein